MALTLTGSPPITAAALDAAVNTELSTNWFPLAGVTNGSNASAGNIGEYISQSVPIGSAATMTTGTTNTIASISLTPGDWDVSGNVVTAPAGSTVTSVIACGISTSISTLPTLPGGGGYTQATTSSAAGAVNAVAISPVRINVSVTTSVYLVADIGFTVSTMGCYGFIGARRVR